MESVGQTAWRPNVPTGAMRHDDDEKCWHWTRSTYRVMRKRVKMRGQSKWKNRYVVVSLKSWWKKWEMTVGGGGGEVKFYIIYCKWFRMNYLASKEFFFSESICRGNYLYTPRCSLAHKLQHTHHTTTHLSAPLLVNINVFARLLCCIANLNGLMYTVDLWMNVYLENC